jgi:aryl-alcohol dehydrogenase-like predicted oxidoreductase
MEYRLLGDTGLRVSALCMGTMTFGREADRKESAAMFGRCRDTGINLFDCANSYSGSEAERILGELIAGCRDEVILTTKVASKTGNDLNARGASRRHIMLAVEASLKRLNTDRIDLYIMHRFDELTPLEETLRALDDLTAQGKILYAGASNYAAWQVMKALGISAEEGLGAFKCIQPMYNLVKRQAEVEMLPMALSERLGVIVYNPLGGGLLTGKYAKAGRAVDSARLDANKTYRSRYGDAWMHETARRFAEFARAEGFTPASLAIAWVAHHPAVTAPILGARSVTQLEDSLRAADIRMTEDLYNRIAAFSPAPPSATDRSETVKSPNDI